MNPKDFPWTAEQSVTVTNPTAEPFTWMVHNKAYELGPGKSAKMPGYIAWIYVYNQAVKKAQAANVFNSWNDEGFKQQYFDEFVAGYDDLIQEIEEEPNFAHILMDICAI